MTREELLSAEVPFTVKSVSDGRLAVVKGFSENDPLGVGGGMFPDIPTAYFEGGGWVLVDDLMKHFACKSLTQNER